MYASRPLFLCIALLLVALQSLAQTTPVRLSTGGAPCSMPEPPLRSEKPDIFNDQQEQWLGDAQASELEASYDLVPEKESEELVRLGQKLLAQLPPTPIQYRFRVYESETANAFSIAGGYVYVSRKLITDARSEDELAGVLAHEIGHIYTHQVAIGFTRGFKAKLNVTSVGDRADIEDKFQLFLNAPWKDAAGESEDQAEKDELLADRVGMYALIRAGYAPKAFAQNLDRIADNKGHTGNALTDLLGATGEISMRVRTARKITASLPQGCGDAQAASSDAFTSFQQAIRSAPVRPLINPTQGLTSFKLDPAMRPALSQVLFSPNAAYVLVQDESSIHVLSRSPLKRLFSIDALGAEPAHFTPDSSKVVFHYRTMRVERWDIASTRRESYFELVDYDGCPQTSLSPDGKTFVCLNLKAGNVWLKLSDVDSGQVFYDNKNFSSGPAGDIIVRRPTENRLGTVAYSQDGNTVLIASGIRAMAFDLKSRKAIGLGKDLSKLIEGRLAFIDSDKLAYECDWDAKAGTAADTFKICVASFPDGTLLNTFKIGYQWMEPVSHGSRILIGPFKENAALLADPSTGMASAGFKMESLDIYDQWLAIENERGGVTVGDLAGQHMESIDLPVSVTSSLEAAAFSPDGRFLAYSNKARSSIWDLKAQKRVALMRPFRAVRFNDQDLMFAQYNESHQRPGQNYQIDLKTGKAAEGAKFAIDQFQRGDVMVTFQPLEKTGDVGSNVNLQVADTGSGALLWSKHFAHQVPLVRQTEDGSLLFISDLYDQTATDESHHASAKLVKTSDTRSEWIAQGLLVGLVDSHTGEVRREVQVPERFDAEGGGRSAAVYGDFLAVQGAENNSVIYRVSDGVRLGAFFGRVIAGDAKLKLLAATNRDQDIMIINATNGKELKRVTVDNLPRVARIIPDKNQLLVLTASQRVYAIDLPSVTTTETASSH
jgi:WD40 repeat protein